MITSQMAWLLLLSVIVAVESKKASLPIHSSFPLSKKASLPIHSSFPLSKKVSLPIHSSFPLSVSEKAEGTVAEEPAAEDKCTLCSKMYKLSDLEYEKSPRQTADKRKLCVRKKQVLRCIAKIEKRHKDLCSTRIDLMTLRSGTITEMNKKCQKFEPLDANQYINILREQRERDKDLVVDKCKYSQPSPHLSELKHCGMFGDPHLKTFSDQRQTCVVAGAWSLVDNRHLAIQASNDILQETQSSSATATSKISIVIKESSSCVSQKVYIATAKYLPSQFVDATRSTGTPTCRSYIRRETKDFVFINICHINTTVIIRRIGKFLTFNIRSPFEIANESSGLCAHGCPKSELVDYARFFRRSDNDVEKAREKTSAMDICWRANLTDFYYDSCVFDILSTRDTHFAQAARVSMRDARELDVKIRLRRENSVLLNPQPLKQTMEKSSGQTSHSCDVRTLMFLLTLVFYYVLTS